MSTTSALLKIARTAIERHLSRQKAVEETWDDPALYQHAGAFVTLRRGSELRGCIGQMFSDEPLYQTVQANAIAAATHDPRFPPVRLEELPALTIEVSVLSPMEAIDAAHALEQIEIGRHGIMIEKHGRRGVFLPEVATDFGWDAETFLDQLCWKAGLPPGSWKTGANLHRFTTEKISEEDL